jgi:D-alanyl-D-alanine carboxypeptidase
MRVAYGFVRTAGEVWRAAGSQRLFAAPRRLIAAALVVALAVGPTVAVAKTVAVKPPAKTVVDKSPYIVVDVESGMVIADRQADQLWYPASLTKLMTAYIAFRDMASGYVTPATKVVETRTAAAQFPVKMGFQVGTKMTLDAALKMMIVPSANDIAVAIAEALGGNLDAFVGAMNSEAARLGMSRTHFANPNGLPDEAHVSTARDLAILARQIWVEFPQHRGLFRIQAISSGGSVFRSPNLPLLGRYRGAEGMKTGFTCDAGYNLAATATRNGRTLLVVVLGRTSSIDRAELAARLLNEGFARKTVPDEAIELAAFNDPATDPGPVDMRVCTGSSVARVKFTDSALGRTAVATAPVKADADIPPGKTRPPVPNPGVSRTAKAGTAGTQGTYVPPVLAELPEKRRYRISDSDQAERDDEG